jgi:hypothetical protein
MRLNQRIHDRRLNPLDRLIELLRIFLDEALSEERDV